MVVEVICVPVERVVCGVVGGFLIEKDIAIRIEPH